MVDENNSSTEKPKVLIVDDHAEDIHILWNELKGDFEVFAAVNGEQTFRRIQENPPDLILLDVVMPGMSGHEVCRRLKADPATRNIPVVFITAKDDERDETEGFDLGAADYISKPFRLAVVRSRVETILKLKKEMDLREKLTDDLRQLNEELEEKVEEKVGELRLAHEEIRASETTLRTVLENILDIVFTTDTKGDFNFICANIPKIIGHSLDELNEMGNVEKLIGDAQSEFKTLRNEGFIHDLERFIVDKEGNKRSFLITVTTVIITDQVWIWTCREITERQKMENRLRQAYKMEAIGTLAGGIAHDFNNILSAIVGYTEVSLESVEESSPVYDYLSRVMEAGTRAKDLVRHILLFSRESEHELTPIKIALPIREALRLLRASVPTTVEIKQSITSEAAALADPTQIHQLVMNLCTNAAHAMREKGGVLFIELTDEIVTEQSADQPDLPADSYVRLVVSDTGHGIPPHLLDRIYDPFFTTKEKSEGTGMGLSVVHGIIVGHKGFIYVDSEVDQGTTFTIYIPSLEQKRTGIDKSIQTHIEGGSERILVVDDDVLIAEVEQTILKSLGYEVVVNTSPVEALELFRQDSDGFDLIITDLTMPKLTGLEFAERIREIHKDLPILLCTGYGVEINEKMVKKYGIGGVIYKPLLKGDIATKIRGVLDL